ncbi:hypothetical protein ACFQDN_16090 [Pseudomonas asuensis]|uniref:Uncharacterized protein n=1 Tax=Pseudomonas asuensis TaxID=1825787 RepID=A0ABQ2GLQ4_9PSED|nr:hypothetical protein [Pseudomonas asuensis]GGM01251.1 hypothetical protein GCM10009425_10560 [Pseudomonas asuensis]
MKEDKSSHIHLNTDEPEPPPSKAGCLWMTVGAIAFAFALFGGMIYLFTRGPSPQVEANERNTIEACHQRADAAAADSSDRLSIQQSCQEMEKQFIKKYGHAPNQ